MEELLPRAIVRELDKYIIGQNAAKRAVAIALRNRRRRQLLPDGMAEEVRPKNILMIGPTGVGKTEIARRVARLLEAPFIRVEATKFTEVGYVGKDAESIIHDLADVSVNQAQERSLKEVEGRAEALAAERILNYLCQQKAAASGSNATAQVAAQAGIQSAGGVLPDEAVVSTAPVTRAVAISPRRRKRLAELLAAHQFEDSVIEIDLPSEGDDLDGYWEFSSSMSAEEISASFNQFMQGFPLVEKRRKRKVSVREARHLLSREEASKLVDFDQVVEEAVKKVENTGVVFIDELDKLAGNEFKTGPDVSGEGVQRDLLPIVEGTTVVTRFGPVKTDHILFIAAGSFYQSKPSDLIPELQGRFPLRVELDGLTEADLERILTEPENSLLKQYQALLATEGVELAFEPDAVRELACTAAEVNHRAENIGARRLHTVLEQALEEISFEAPERKGERVVIDRDFVRSRLKGAVQDEDFSRYIL